MKRLFIALLTLLLCLSLTGFAAGESAVSTSYSSTLQFLSAVGSLGSLGSTSPDRWQKVSEAWKSTGDIIHALRLPEDLPDPDGLCIVVLGYQLNPDGSMRDELLERLKVALTCAGQYPEAWILCTGGPTASGDPTATEAGRMTEWLEENGVDARRLLKEERSLTTLENAVYSLEILRTVPGIHCLALVSSDYHIPAGIRYFQAVSILTSQDPDHPDYPIHACAAWPVRGDGASQ